ncbi:MAG TPA: P-II family nitrogen regulator [Gemmataceae bacterium]|nr:P-II family nitrogen regulator [Gemmataceae bacterium]
MNLVTAVIRPQQLGAVQKALKKCGIDQMTISNVLGGGHEPGYGFIYRSTTIDNKLQARIKLEIAVDDNDVENIVDAIQLSAKTGKVGDGLIWVLPIAHAVRIRTGEDLTWQAAPRPAAPASTRASRLHDRFATVH